MDDPIYKDDQDDQDDQDLNVETPASEGEESVSGSTPAPVSDDDVGKMVEDVIGEEPEQGKPFSLAEEMEKDEKAEHDIPPDGAKVYGAVKDEDQFSEE